MIVTMDLFSPSKFLLVICVLCGLSRHVRAMSASFYGNSYIRLPLDSASSTTEIKLHFRTHRPNGLLLFTAGRTDYCIIELQSGMVQVRLSLGSGEASLWSPPGLPLDDLAWHYVHLVQSQGDVTLTIDRSYVTRTKTPGNLFELNIQHGIFLGGMGTFTDVFRGNFHNFRGCMRYVLFNNMDVFHDVRLQKNPMNLYEITWDCSAEFGASSDQPISLLKNTSYIAFPHFHAREGGTVSFDIRTKTPTALVFYNSGWVTNRDFVALELIEGRIRVTVDKGSGPLVLDSGMKVNDGRWHQVEMIVTFNSLEVIVDDKRKDLRSNFGNQRYLDLTGHLFLGGVGLSSRAHAKQKGLFSLRGTHSSAGSLMGCIRNLKLNDRLMGLGEAQVTHAIRPNCIWQYSCNRRPCLSTAVCIEEGYTGFRCECGQSNCYKSADEIEETVSISELIVLQNVRVREGMRTIITSNNIDLTLEYTRYNLLESDVVFRVVTPPKHGQVFVDISSGAGTPTFTLEHLNKDKVFYIHDGSESIVDSMGIELEFVSTSSTLPSQLRHKYGFTLIARILPENDRPVLKLPQDETLVVVEKTMTRITPRLINVIDADTDPTKLVYTVEYQQSEHIGYFQKEDRPGEREKSFTQEDINIGQISYVHRGMRRLHVRLQVTDGTAVSEAVILHIHAKPLELITITNTGIKLPPLSTHVILPSNLTMATNAPNKEVDIRYHITQVPRYGLIQRQQYADQSWVSVSSFSQRHINKGRIRYVHTDSNHYQEDLFKFIASIAGARTSVQEFHVKFVHVVVEIGTNNELVLNGIKQMAIRGQQLQAQSNLASLSTRSIIYTLHTAPQHGHLLKMRDRSKSVHYHRHRLNVGANFTQYDIDSGFIWYRMHNAQHREIMDSIKFRVSVPGAVSTLTTFSIRYKPIESDILFINNELVDVPEGGSKIVTKNNLYMETELIKRYRYSLLSYPAHGVIKLIDPGTGSVTHQNVSTFTNADIVTERVVYQHDDSETDFDSFSFMTTPILDWDSIQPEEIEEMSATFEIRVLLRNDRRPVRMVKKIFQVVKNDGRRITNRDFNYHDPDANFDSKKLQYHREQIENGEIVRSDNHSVEVYEFTQEEVNDGKLYFKHSGDTDGQFSLWVSDGYFQVTGTVEVEASEPYVRITNNEGLKVEKGQKMRITHQNITVDTNMDVDENDITFFVRKSPQHGRIKLNGVGINHFTLSDLMSGKLAYHHDDSNNLEDSFEYTIRVKDIQIQGETKVKVFLESHYRPPKVVKNKVLVVDEEETAVIGKSNLQINHQETSPGNIMFTVKLAPNFGDLRFHGDGTNREVELFSQADINNNRLLYQQKVPGQYIDRFIFDVTNGIQTLRGLEFIIEIIPLTIPLDVANISMNEGERKLLPDYLFKVPNKYFQHDSFEYVIIKQPTNGWIQFTDPGQHLAQFTSEELQNGQVYYAHDDSDTVSDRFSILAKSKTTGKQSNPHTVYLSVIPVNDQRPKVTENRGLRVWIKSTTPITAESLQTVDPDTPAEKLVYRVSRPSNGHIEMLGEPGVLVREFTQRNISDGNVVFVHSGSEEGNFKFKVSDGIHTTEEILFQIHAVQLVLSLATKEELLVFPGTVQPITSQHLNSKTNDPNQSEPIMYTLQSKPKYGKLQLKFNGKLKEATQFSQNEIERTLVFYRHTEAMTGWSVTDSFVFEVSTKYAADIIRYQNFDITISFNNIHEENIDQLISIADVHCQEGDQVVIGEREFDVTILKQKLIARGIRQTDIGLLITQVPQHGYLLVDNKNATVGTKLTQRIINRGKLIYRHDNSDTKWDAFYFAIQISKDGQSMTSRVQPNVFNITILPLNDRPFRIVTRYPSLSVLQGATANITNRHLQVLDPDSPPTDITYRIIKHPNNGKLVYRKRPQRQPKSFTQDDIDRNDIVFTQDGSLEAGTFTFRVSDGKFPAYHETFRVNVIPLTLDLVNLTKVFIVQGKTTFFLTRENIAARTNGLLGDVSYKVTKPPELGKLFIGDKVVSNFTQFDVDSASLLYIQTSLNSYTDSFTFSVENPQKKIENNLLKIVVVPLVKQKPFTATVSNNIQITTDVLDASELATRTDSDPKFTIQTHPKFGELIKFSNGRGLRDASVQPGTRLESFTQKDIEKGALSYQAHPSMSYSPINDSFVYILTARNVQPARGMFSITVKPPGTTAPPSRCTGGSCKESHVTIIPITSPAPASTRADEKKPAESGTSLTEEKKGNTHLTVILVIFAVIILIIIIIIVVRCIKKRRKSRDYDMRKDNGAEKQPLPPSNVHMEPRHCPERSLDRGDRTDFKNTNIPVVSVSSDQLQQITTTVGSRPRSAPTSPQTKRADTNRSVPMCKVTPLQDDDEVQRKTPSTGTWKSNEDCAEQQSFDWDNIDPELLQHCRTTNPVLHKDRYWV